MLLQTPRACRSIMHGCCIVLTAVSVLHAGAVQLLDDKRVKASFGAAVPVITSPAPVPQQTAQPDAEQAASPGAEQVACSAEQAVLEVDGPQLAVNRNQVLEEAQQNAYTAALQVLQGLAKDEGSQAEPTAGTKGHITVTAGTATGYGIEAYVAGIETAVPLAEGPSALHRVKLPRPPLFAGLLDESTGKKRQRAGTCYYCEQGSASGWANMDFKMHTEVKPSKRQLERLVSLALLMEHVVLSLPAVWIT